MGEQACRFWIPTNSRERAQEVLATESLSAILGALQLHATRCYCNHHNSIYDACSANTSPKMCVPPSTAMVCIADDDSGRENIFFHSVLLHSNCLSSTCLSSSFSLNCTSATLSTPPLSSRQLRQHYNNPAPQLFSYYYGLD